MLKSIFNGEPICWPISRKTGSLQTNAGVFPYNQTSLESFGREYLEAIDKLDILLSWQRNEVFLWKNELIEPSVKKVSFRIVEKPFRVVNPWTKVLEGKKVLVVSPFAPLIKEQFKIADKIFEKRLLPDFYLETMKAENTAGLNWKNSKFSTWKEALDSMKEDLAKRQFDIALLGCGAYAFPLGAFCKSLGKSAITTCGATQLYFGIYGTRWAWLPEINEYWKRPDPSYRPEGSLKIENGAYW